MPRAEPGQFLRTHIEQLIKPPDFACCPDTRSMRSQSQSHSTNVFGLNISDLIQESFKHLARGWPGAARHPIQRYITARWPVKNHAAGQSIFNNVSKLFLKF